MPLHKPVAMQQAPLGSEQAPCAKALAVCVDTLAIQKLVLAVHRGPDWPCCAHTQSSVVFAVYPFLCVHTPAGAAHRAALLFAKLWLQ
jgi:hypothetical protein